MAIRILKIILMIFVGLQAFIYATQNIANLDSAYQAVAYVLSMEGHEIYPSSFGPAFAHPVLVWMALAVILAGEYAVALLSAKGVWDLWQARKSAADFNGAKTYAILGCGMALVVWFGFFSVIGGAYFQMWQTELGGNSMRDALHFLVTSGLVMLFVNMRDD